MGSLFEAFVRYGGTPGIAGVGLEQDKASTPLDGIYPTVSLRDILECENIGGGVKTVRLIDFLIDLRERGQFLLRMPRGMRSEACDTEAMQF